MKKIGVVVVLAGLAAGFAFAGGGQQKAASGPQKVSFWYNNTGEEAKVYEQAIAAYNASQTNYVVEGLSVNDQQKLIVALASNESPDVVQQSNSLVVSFQGQGLIQSLKPYIDKEKFDTGIYSAKSIEANTVGGELYALPLDGYSIQMFYNKDLLAKAGYTEPPKTVEEMYAIGTKATTLDAAGNIDVLGYPIAPLTAARQELIYAWGGRWWAKDRKTLTPQDAGVIASLKANVEYRKKFGIDKVYAYVATANTNRYTENDVFFAGRQLFRLDGPWLPTMMQKFGSKVNWGIALIPSPAANPAGRGTCRFETDSEFIPINAPNKEGAWDFIKWLTSAKGAKIVNMGNGTLPAVKALYDDAEVLAKPGFKEFIDSLKLENGIQYPLIKDFAEYTSMINATVDDVYSGKQTPEQATAALAAKAKNLK